MLYFRECKAIKKNIVYLVFLAIVVIFYMTQINADLEMDIPPSERETVTMEGGDVVPSGKSEPITIEGSATVAPNNSNAENYGYTDAEIPEMVMPNAMALLATEYSANEFISYPNGFYKKTKLSTEELNRIDEIIEEVTGLTGNEIVELIDTNVSHGKSYPAPGGIAQLGEVGDYSDVIPVIVDYDTFKEKIKIADELIGGESSYTASNLSDFGYKPLTEEDVEKERQALIKDDKITNAYARLFCDYMGIVIAMFAVFVPVAFLLRDRRSKINELLYPKKISAVKLILTRYLSVVSMIFLPILIISLIPLVQIAVYAFENGYSIDYFAFIKYSFGWLFPTVLVTTGVGFFFTILTEMPIGILIQFVWSFMSVFAGAGNLTALAGENGTALIIRFNTIGSLAEVEAQMWALIVNRVSYCILALVLLAASIIIFELKRKGILNFNGSIVKKYISNKKAT